MIVKTESLYRTKKKESGRCGSTRAASTPAGFLRKKTAPHGTVLFLKSIVPVQSRTPEIAKTPFPDLCEPMSHAIENAGTGTGKLLLKLTRDSAGIFYHTAEPFQSQCMLFALRSVGMAQGGRDGWADGFPAHPFLALNMNIRFSVTNYG